jgi:hypothetical protein
MQVEGITWYAVTLEDDEFAAMKKLVVEVFGLTPLIDQEGWALFPMANGTLLDLYAPDAIPERLQRRHRVRVPCRRHRSRLRRTRRRGMRTSRRDHSHREAPVLTVRHAKKVTAGTS